MFVQVLAATRRRAVRIHPYQCSVLPERLLFQAYPSFANTTAVEFDFTKPDTMKAALKGSPPVFVLSLILLSV